MAGEAQSWKISVGEVDWVEPSDRVHHAVNVGKEVFEEVVTFFLDRPEAPQPEADSNYSSCGSVQELDLLESIGSGL